MNTEMNKHQISAKLQECTRAEGFILHVAVVGTENTVELDKFISFSGADVLNSVQEETIRKALALAGAPCQMEEEGEATPPIEPITGEAPDPLSSENAEIVCEEDGSQDSEKNSTSKAARVKKEKSSAPSEGPSPEESPEEDATPSNQKEPEESIVEPQVEKQEDKQLTYEEALEVKLTFKEGFKPTKVLANLKGLTMRELLAERPQMLGLLANPDSSMVASGDIKREAHIAAVVIKNHKE